MIMTVSLNHYSSYLVTDSSPITLVSKKIQWHISSLASLEIAAHTNWQVYLLP